MKTAPLTPRMLIAAGVVGGAVLAGMAALWMAPRHDLSVMPLMARYTTPDGHDISVQTHELTINEWNLCHAEGGCTLHLRPPVGRADKDYPATGLSWVDVREYIDWINASTGQKFRLPSMAEWHAMAAPVLPEEPDPIFTDPALSWASAYLTDGLGSRRLEPSGSYSVSAEGIADLDGNVWEWTQDCATGADVSADSCPAFYVMGEHETVISYLIRDPARGGCAMGAPPAHLGMRLVLEEQPGG